VRPVPVQPRSSGAVDAELHAGPPAQAVDVAWDSLDDEVAADPGQPPELLGHQLALEEPLARQRDVLPVAAAAPTRPRVLTGRLHPVG